MAESNITACINTLQVKEAVDVSCFNEEVRSSPG